MGKIFFVIIILFILYWKFPQSFRSVVHFIADLSIFQDTTTGEISWQKLGTGIEIAEAKTKSELSHLTISVFMIRIDPARFSVRVHLDRNLTTAAAAARATNAIGTINGSFFDPQGRPLGLIIQRGRVIQSMPKSGMRYSGVFFMLGNKPYIVHRSQFQNIGIDEALQSMPRLISGYTPIPDIDDQKIKRRSGIAIDRRNRIIFAVTDTHLSGLTLRDFQKFLSNPNLRIKSALNLDGGRSSQLFFNYGNYEKSISGLSAAPVFVSFFQNK
ncbi:MAG: phosphodiester glycosidase family protein [Calditrichaeota bacterium]|nr:phosphodiester glycosidase family protein [Calditrichota bacterium]